MWCPQRTPPSMSFAAILLQRPELRRPPRSPSRSSASSSFLDDQLNLDIPRSFSEGNVRELGLPLGTQRDGGSR